MFSLLVNGNDRSYQVLCSSSVALITISVSSFVQSSLSDKDLPEIGEFVIAELYRMEMIEESGILTPVGQEMAQYCRGHARRDAGGPSEGDASRGGDRLWGQGASFTPPPLSSFDRASLR